MSIDDTTQAQTGLSTQPAVEPAVVGIGLIGWMRWLWRTLTSMRVALILLFLLALAAIPGSVFPQRATDPIDVKQYIANNPTWGPVMDRVGLFDVFAAPWFAAVYLLLMLSLAGCVIPRVRSHWRAMRAAPPAAPSRLSRMPEYRTFQTQADAAGVLTAAQTLLSSSRWRVASSTSQGWVAAEKGYLRETGNLLFHLSLLALLVAVGFGSMLGSKGQVIVREGSTFSNTLTQFDSFNPGRLYSPDKLPPFSVTLDDFHATYQETGMQRGAPRDFAANVTVKSNPDSAGQREVIGVNEPLSVDGTKVYLVGHGYAPTFTVTDSKGQVLLKDSVVFLPQDGNFTSDGVIKLPDTNPQLGFTGVFLPTAAADSVRGGFSSFPAANDPRVFLSVWTGNLGLDSGVPQSVYRLDTSKMTRQGLKALAPGQTWTLPNGLGTLTFTGVTEYATFNINTDPGSGFALAAAALAIIGLSLSLFVRRRRIWVRVSDSPEGLSVVEVGALARTEAPGLDSEIDAVTTELEQVVERT